ncbi:MAG TPA: hypothetical protein VF760_02220, partial [Xanthobacteraceae bacterium]
MRIRAAFRHFVADLYMAWNDTSQASPTHPPPSRDRELTDLIRAILISTRAWISNGARAQRAQRRP